LRIDFAVDKSIERIGAARPRRCVSAADRR
jgi:hypothetical protein